MKASVITPLACQHVGTLSHHVKQLESGEDTRIRTTEAQTHISSVWPGFKKKGSVPGDP